MTAQIMSGPDIGKTTFRGWWGWPSRQRPIGCGREGLPRGWLSWATTDTAPSVLRNFRDSTLGNRLHMVLLQTKPGIRGNFFAWKRFIKA
jgi:hypothetical protein